jgi:hypothetical protein
MPEAPAGSHYVFVQLGLNNNNFIEVKGGLKEGDIILIEVVTQNSLGQGPMMMGAPVMRVGPGGPMQQGTTFRRADNTQGGGGGGQGGGGKSGGGG